MGIVGVGNIRLIGLVTLGPRPMFGLSIIILVVRDYRR